MRAFLSLSLLCLASATISSITELREANITNSVVGQMVGQSVAICVGFLAVGAPATHAGADEVGSVYMYFKDAGGPDNWGIQQELFAPDAANGDKFGYALDVEMGHVLVGAPEKAQATPFLQNVGYVYYYLFNGTYYNHVQTLSNPQTCTSLTPTCQGNYFGKAVAYQGVTLVVGAPSFQNGIAYVYIRDGTDTFSLQHTFTQTGLTSLAGYGSSVAVQDTLVVIGAPLQVVGGKSGAGQVWVYGANYPTTGAYGLIKILTSTTPGAGYNFGFSVSTYSTTVVVGAPNEHNGGVNSGQVYVFDRNFGGSNNFGMVQQLPHPGSAALDYYGTSVYVSEDVISAGAPGFGVSDTGRLYVWQRTALYSWGLFSFIDGQNSGDMFGTTTYVHLPNMMVGAPEALRESLEKRGTAYFYSVTTSGSGFGDPHFVGFDGSEYNFNGQAGATFAIVSDVNFVINAEFIDQTVKGVTGTWMRRISIVLPTETLLIDASVSSCLFNNSIMLREEMTWQGHGLRIETHSDQVNVHLGPWVANIIFRNQQAADSAYLDLHMQLNSLPSNPHGVLGQTARYLVDGSERLAIHSTGLNGEGVVAGSFQDYMVDSLFDTNFAFSTYQQPLETGMRASQEEFPIKAYTF